MKIIYEDKDIIVVHKEAGLPVQSRSSLTQDLESMLLTDLMKKNKGGQKPELHVINRLDQPVEGLVLFAKNKKAAAGLSRQLTEGKIDKIYRAEVTGMIPEEEDILTDYLLKDGRTNTSRVVAQGTPKSKQAVLSYKRLSDNELEIRLMTGRHHQIRVQLSNAGMPIKGSFIRERESSWSCRSELNIRKGPLPRVLCNSGPLEFYIQGIYLLKYHYSVVKFHMLFFDI